MIRNLKWLFCPIICSDWLKFYKFSTWKPLGRFDYDVVVYRAVKKIFGPQGKRKLGSSSNSPNNDIQTKSTMVCHKQGISTTKNELMNCDLENSFLLVYLAPLNSWSTGCCLGWPPPLSGPGCRCSIDGHVLVFGQNLIKCIVYTNISLTISHFESQKCISRIKLTFQHI